MHSDLEKGWIERFDVLKNQRPANFQRKKTDNRRWKYVLNQFLNNMDKQETQCCLCGCRIRKRSIDGNVVRSESEGPLSDCDTFVTIKARSSLFLSVYAKH